MIPQRNTSYADTTRERNDRVLPIGKCHQQRNFNTDSDEWHSKHPSSRRSFFNGPASSETYTCERRDRCRSKRRSSLVATNIHRELGRTRAVNVSPGTFSDVVDDKQWTVCCHGDDDVGVLERYATRTLPASSLLAH
ncbi:hypothetical protein LSAT2_003323 [Lamellibrachia satsuma]|nr:hypothetical protein LSAT2_003323 [Lamellibrachia satsuma]